MNKLNGKTHLSGKQIQISLLKKYKLDLVREKQF